MQEVKEYFLSQKDDQYRLLNKKLNIAIDVDCYGVRLPIIRTYAKTLNKKYSFNYLMENIDINSYEEILLRGFIIGNNKKLTLDELTNYIDRHLPLISDWSMCDTFVSSLKITNKYLDELWPYLVKKLHTKKVFTIRFVLVMLLNYYVNSEYQTRIYDVIGSIQNDDYYVKMANAWLISYMLIAYYDNTISFIKNSTFDKWTLAKGITKAIESRQIDIKKKEDLKKLRNAINNK